MKRIAYDKTWTDDEWREMNFSQQALLETSNTGGRQPSADELIAAARKYGPEGILEAAIGLTQTQFQRVENAIKKGGK